MKFLSRVLHQSVQMPADMCGLGRRYGERAAKGDLLLSHKLVRHCVSGLIDRDTGNHFTAARVEETQTASHSSFGAFDYTEVFCLDRFQRLH